MFRYAEPFKHLVIESCINFRKTSLDRFINISLWIVLTILINGFIMSRQFAITPQFGAFMLTGCLGSCGLFECYPTVTRIVGDLEGERSIFYYLNLPVPASFIFIKMMINVILQGFIQSLVVLPLGKLLLWNSLSFAHVSWSSLFLLLIIINVFYGIFALWVSSITTNLANLSNVWNRVIFPLWVFGGYQYSWKTLYAVSKPIAYLALLNPVTYAMEATRALLLGQSEYLNVWLCLGMLCLYSIAGYYDMMRRFKRRLDFV